MEPAPIVVIGAGISGLAAAHHLLERWPQRGRRWSLLVLEASEQCGGVIRTIERDDLLLDTGPDNFITTKPWALDLSRRLGIDDQLIPTSGSHKRALVVRRGRLLPVPDGFLLMAPTRWWPIISTPIFSLPGKLRMAMERLIPRRELDESSDESLASFVTRRFGREALERLVQPLMSGVYTAVPESLSLRATMPQFLDMEREHGSVIRGMRRAAASRKRGESGARYSMFMTYRRGMRTLTDALAGRIGSQRIQTGCRAVSIASVAQTPDEPTVRWCIRLDDGRDLLAAGVILAGSTQTSARLLTEAAPMLSRMLMNIEYASAAVVHLAYARRQVGHPLDAYGFVVPRQEKRRLIAASFSSVKYEGRAPQDKVLIRVVMGGALQPQLMQLDDDDLVHAAHDELRSLLHIDGQPELSLVHRHHQVMPQYTVGHLKGVAAIHERTAALRGLELAGNGFEGVGVPDCIHAGEQAAERLLASLDRPIEGEDTPFGRAKAGGSYRQSGSDSSMSPVTA